MKIIFFANADWYLFNFRLGLAKYLRERGAEVVMISPAGDYAEKIRSEGFRWICVPMVRYSLNPLREIGLLWHLIRIYKNEKPDLVHHFTIKCVVYGGIAARIANIRALLSAVTGMGYIFSSDDFLANVLRPFIRWFLLMAINRESARLILQNPDDRKFFVSNRLVKDKSIRVIASSGVDTRRFCPVPHKFNAEKLTPRVVFSSRLLWSKGLREFVEAARKMKLAGIKAEFLIAGKPDLANPQSIMPDTLINWQKEAAVTFCGHVDDMATFLKKAHIVVLPSYYGEGVPRSLTEAAAVGLPIVTTDTPGCREVVDNEVNGFLIPAHDVDALVEALIKLIMDPELIAKMGAASRGKALAEFDEQIVFKKTVDVYNELLTKLNCREIIN